MPCVSRRVNGSSMRDQAEVAHHAGPEARVEQVQDRVLDAADVLVHRQPVVDALVHHGALVVRAGVAHVVPGRVHEGVHGVGLARAPACRTWGSRRAGNPARRLSGLPVPSGTQSSGSTTGSCSSGTGTSPQAAQWMRGIGRAPVALARDAPVAQPLLHALVAQPLGLEVARRSRPPRPGRSRPSYLPELMQRAVVRIRAARRAVRIGLAVDVDHRRDRQAVLVANAKSRSSWAGTRHHGAFAVAHQHVVADPHRESARRSADAVTNRPVGMPFFSMVARSASMTLPRLHSSTNAASCGFPRRGVRRERMLGGHRAEGRAHQRVGAGGEHAQQRLRRPPARRGSRCSTPFAAADPVGLHQLHALRPAGQLRRARPAARRA